MKYCDLVMKGGITSGIVYPNAVLALARDYRFKNIGGTSAGAIAAAASAAAAYGDRCKAAKQALQRPADRVGFEGLEVVAKQLASEGFIYKLFQPARGAGSAYRLLVRLTGNASTVSKGAALIVAVVTIAPIEMVLLLAVLFGIAFLADGKHGLWAAALPAILCAYIGGIIAALLRVAHVVRGNLLGLCSGLHRKRWFGRGEPALTDWLHSVLQDLSGKPSAEPLTFCDLWNAPRYEDEPKTPKALALQMITTSVSHHEPRTLPFENGRFWFRHDQFAKLFPADIVAWLVERAGEPIACDGGQFYRLVDGGDLPVLVGMRMSLSFPLLISAVPLHEPANWDTSPATETSDAAKGDEGENPTERSILDSTDSLTSGGRRAAGRTITGFRVCWFSDGGISSNFPVHLFDAPLPVWPTFAINLVYPGPNDGPAPEIALPTSNNAGWQRTYQSIAKPVAAAEIASFLFGIIGTMQNWRDLLLARAPGQRDRIVPVPLASDEGGMNLNMPQKILTSISEKGTKAGGAFAAFPFDNHYWIRWRNLASALQRYTIRIADNADSKPPIADYANAYRTARTGKPSPPSYQFRSTDRQEAAKALLKCLEERGKDWEDLGPDFTVGAPRPLPQMQISPTF
ncbi:patatin-like phospholipase family protein [Novosphingobium humi]|uniref:Patatin-like phospholipase family protein n=1 Tax=Novosphingobium humi TaxID=2282397 RepID=A0ABY7U0M0_9SPHN|nr:patatin-like phospholipase family protein [Novosphingobium humi]WCT79082.1 patatin-like phospholipase family protein [Novosphingobium humi]